MDGSDFFSAFANSYGDTPFSPAAAGIAAMPGTAGDFFSPRQHFDFLRQQVLPGIQGPFRIWSIGGGSGEHPYSLAMLCHHQWGAEGWEVVASDTEPERLIQGRQGRYAPALANSIPEPYRSRYSRLGSRSLCLARSLRRGVHFVHLKLHGLLPPFAPFDAVFLQRGVDLSRPLAHLLPRVKRGGHVFYAQPVAEHCVPAGLVRVGPDVFRRDF